MSKTSITALEIVEVLRDDIIKGNLKPREHLVETALAKRFQVSRTPIREAVRQLAGLGLVKQEAYKGAIVADIDVKEIVDIYTVRSSLEGLATRLAAEHLTEADFEKMGRQIDLMEQSKSVLDLERYTRANEEFHNIIFIACGNNYLIKTIGDMLERTDSFRNTSWSTNLSPVSHADILHALREGDANKAQRLAEQHISLINFDI